MIYQKQAHKSQEAFKSDVLKGLSLSQKTLPSRWLYDDRGSELFERITQVADYYPTRTETDILRRYGEDISAFCGARASLIEYGAGAAVKTEILLSAMDAPAAYLPIDIARDFLVGSVQRMAERFPRLVTRPVIADFTRDFDLPALPTDSGLYVAFFPGSTIGNLNEAEASALLTQMRRHVGPYGRAVIGFDLIKSINTLIRAYDDSEGITAAFNFNLLERINRELVGNFPIDRFSHEARWNSDERAMEMHLVSLDARAIQVAGRTFTFGARETIHTESSRKYSLTAIRELAERTGWAIEHAWMDADHRFVVTGMRTLATPTAPALAVGKRAFG